MKSNPDIYLLYEYMKKISFTVRVKVILDEPADAELLNQAAQEAIKRFPYFSVSVGLDAKGNYFLAPNAKPLPVLPEKDRRLMLGSAETNGHLFAITWRDDTVYFNWAHSICGAFGAQTVLWPGASCTIPTRRAFPRMNPSLAIPAPAPMLPCGTP